MKNILGFLVASLLTVTVYAGFQGFNGDTDLDLFNQFKCDLGLSCSKLEGKFIAKASKGAAATFVDSDLTPDVGAGLNFETGTTTATLTDFDGADIYEGQVIVVISKGAITWDVTSSGIVCGTTNIVTAIGDVSTFMYDGTDWYCLSIIDQSDAQ